tara:strand:- start:558 stop:764 length:207 start_codon:yes stop_codon:yes gene_type:complete
MGYKLIMTSKQITTFIHEVELTEEQYLEYIQNPSDYLELREVHNGPIIWNVVSEEISEGETTYSTSIF